MGLCLQQLREELVRLDAEGARGPFAGGPQVRDRRATLEVGEEHGAARSREEMPGRAEVPLDGSFDGDNVAAESVEPSPDRHENPARGIGGSNRKVATQSNVRFLGRPERRRRPVRWLRRRRFHLGPLRPREEDDDHRDDADYEEESDEGPEPERREGLDSHTVGGRGRWQRAHHRVRGPEIRPELREDRMDGIRTRDEERGRHDDPEENHESPASPPTERRGPRPAHASTCSPREYYFRESVVFILPRHRGFLPESLCAVGFLFIPRSLYTRPRFGRSWASDPRESSPCRMPFFMEGKRTPRRSLEGCSPRTRACVDAHRKSRTTWSASSPTGTASLPRCRGRSCPRSLRHSSKRRRRSWARRHSLRSRTPATPRSSI